MKRPGYLISLGLLAAVLAGSASAVAFWRAGGVRGIDSPTVAALQHPVWLGLGDVLGALAVVAGAAALTGVGVRHSGSSALASFAVLLLGCGAIGAVAVVALDIGLISAADGGVVDAIQFRQRWTWWDGLAWLLLILGLLGVLLLGIGIARRNRVLRLPGAALAGSAVLISLFPPIGIACLAGVFVWMAAGFSRSGASLHPRSTVSPGTS